MSTTTIRSGVLQADTLVDARPASSPATMTTDAVMIVAAAAEESLTPAEKLELSRERLRQAMLPAPKPVHHHHAEPGSSSGMVDAIKTLPGVSVVVDAVEAWWTSHPLRPVVGVAANASTAAAMPMARTHPIRLVLGAALAGALMLRIAPWRWLLRSALFAGLAPQLASRVVARLPIDSWLTMLGSAVSSTPSAAPARPVSTRVEGTPPR